MKKIVSVLLCLSLSACMMACGDETPKQIGGDVQNVTSSSVSADTSADGDVNNAASADDTKGFCFVCDGNEFTVDMDVNEVVNKLGDADSYFEAPSCAFNGIEKTYTYSGFMITTYEDGDVDRIASIILSNDLFSTKEGVTIGDDVSKMKATYGEPTEESDSLSTYVKGDVKLVFVIEAGIVAQIEYDTMNEQ